MPHAVRPLSGCSGQPTAGLGQLEARTPPGRSDFSLDGAALRDVLVEHKMREKRDTGLVFGSNAETRFQPSNVWR